MEYLPGFQKTTDRFNALKKRKKEEKKEREMGQWEKKIVICINSGWEL